MQASVTARSPKPSSLSRREVLLRGAALAIGLAVIPSDVWTRAAGIAGPTRPLLERLCDLVIPSTDTPGAREARVPAFIEAAAAHGLRGADSRLLVEFAQALDRLGQV